MTAEDEYDVSYVNGQGFQQRQGFNSNYRSHPNLSYRSTNVENPQDQYYPSQGQGSQPKFQGFQPKAQTTNAFQPRQQTFAPARATNTFQARQQSFAPSAPFQPNPAPTKTTNEQGPIDRLTTLVEQVVLEQQKLNQKVDAMYTDLNGKFEALSTHVKKLDVQVAQTAEAIQQPQGVLPGRVETNPRNEHARAIRIKDEPTTEPFESSSKIVAPPTAVLSCETKSEQIETIQNWPPLPYGRFSSRSVLESDARHSAVEEINQANRFIEISDGCNTKPKPPPPQQVELMIHRLIDMIQDVTTWQKESDWKRDSMFAELSSAFDFLFATVKRLEVQINQYDDKVEELLILWSGNNRYWNGSLTETPANDLSLATQAAQGNIQPHFLEDKGETSQLQPLQKKDDPGQFVVPCSINGVEFKDAMCDSGSSINLMPRKVAVRLGFANLQPSRITLSFADSSTTVPVGMIADLDIRIGDCLVPTDFQVVEMSKEDEVPLILGRPFMATAGAVMDLPKSRISFTNISNEVFYDILSRPKLTESASCIWAVKKKEEGCTRPKEKPTLSPIPKRPPKKTPIHNSKIRQLDTPWRSSQHFAQISIHIPEELHCLAINEIREKLLATMDLFPDIRSWELKGDKMLGSLQRKQSLHARFSGIESEDPHP